MANAITIPLIILISVTQSTSLPAPPDLCVGPLVHSSHPNPMQENPKLAGCALSCESGKQMYGLSSSEQELVDATTIFGTILCLIGLVILSVNLYSDSKEKSEKFKDRTILYHIPYIITLSTFVLTLLMSLSLISGKDNIICNNNEYSVWNPADGKSVSCTIFGLLFYSSLLYYQFYVLLLSFIVWRQFKNPMNPLWNIRDRYWHLMIFFIVLLLNIISLATSNIDSVEPMGICLAGVADQTQLFLYIVLPLLVSCIVSAICLIWSGYLMKSNIDRHKEHVSKTATKKMVDLFQRIFWYGLGVLLTLSLLFVTGLKFYLKHEVVRDGLKEWINCELTNYYTPDELNMDQNCDALRDDKHKISPFYFMSWIISCFMAIVAQICLSFHSRARARAGRFKQKTLNKITTLGSPKASRESKMNTNASNEKINKLEVKSDESDEYETDLSPHTVTQATFASSTGDGDSPENGTVMMMKLQSDTLTPSSIQPVNSE